MAEPTAGLGLGQLLLALDRTMVTLVEAPRGLDMPVGSVALVDADDVRLGLAVGAGSADVFFLLGVSDAEAVRWIEQQVGGPDGRIPAAIFVKEPTAGRGQARRSRSAPRWWPSNRGPAGNCSTGSSTTPSNITVIAAIRSTTPAPTCSASPSRSPTAPTA